MYACQAGPRGKGDYTTRDIQQNKIKRLAALARRLRSFFLISLPDVNVLAFADCRLLLLFIKRLC